MNLFSFANQLYVWLYKTKFKPVITIPPDRQRKFILVLVFAIALFCRFALCLYNREANDDHMQVINWILDKHEVPQKEDCWECSQPKLYYLLNASVIRFLNIRLSQRIVAAQMINFLFSAVL